MNNNKKQLTDTQKKKVKKLADVYSRGDVAVVEHLLELEEKVESAIQEVKTNAPNINDILSQIKGKDGDDGIDGKDGENGRDGADGAPGPMGPQGIPGNPGRDGVDGEDGEQGPPGPAGKDGKDGSPDTAEDIRNKLELLSGDERLDRKAIKGIEIIDRIPEIERMTLANSVAVPVTTTHFYQNGMFIGRAKNINVIGTVTVTGDTATITASGGSGGTPGGSNTQLQYNNNGVLGGIPNTTYNPSTTRMDIQMNANVGSPVGAINWAEAGGGFGAHFNGEHWTYGNAAINLVPDDNIVRLQDGTNGTVMIGSQVVDATPQGILETQYEDNAFGKNTRLISGNGWNPIDGFSSNGSSALYTDIQDGSSKAGVYLSTYSDDDGSFYGVASMDTNARNYFGGRVGIDTLYPMTNKWLQIGAQSLDVPETVTGIGGNIQYGSGGYSTYSSNPTTTTIRIYSYNTDGINYVFSPTYCEMSVQDDGSSGSYFIDWQWNLPSTVVSGYRVLVQNSTYGYNFDYYTDIPYAVGSIVDFTDSNSWSFGSTVTPNTASSLFYVDTSGNTHVKGVLDVVSDMQVSGYSHLLGKVAINNGSTPLVNLLIGTGGQGLYPTYSEAVINSKYGHQMTISDGWHGNSSEGGGYWVMDAGSDGGFGSWSFLSNSNQVATYVSKNSSQAVFQIAGTGSYAGYFGIDGAGDFIVQTQYSAGYFEVRPASYNGYGSFRAGDSSAKLSINTNDRKLYKSDGTTNSFDWQNLNLNGNWNVVGTLTLSANNIATDTSTGMKIGTATSQKIGLWNATPIVQPTTAIAASTFTANTSGTLNDSATWDGYTIGQVVKALRNIGILA